MQFRHVSVFFMCLVVLEAAVLTGKAFYCRDPDTGKLHNVNTTWISTSFCGNYTCKLRKLNLTETQYTPMRQLNITNINNETNEYSIYNKSENSNKQENVTVTIEERTEPEIEAVIHKDRDNEVNDLIDDKHKNKQKDTTLEVASILNDMARNNDENRYLNENEIKSISEVLHTVKKSDLTAIVDIYKLAQDIYNEIETTKADDSTEESTNTIQDKKMIKKSYWYDPEGHKVKVDIDYPGASQFPLKTTPTKDLPSYFNGALSTHDFGKLPYYYPMSDFQRSSSYMRQPTPEAKIANVKPCKAKLNDMQVTQSAIKPSYLLPYPFAYIRPYNYSDFQNSFYYSTNPLYWDYYNRQRQYQPYFNRYIGQVPPRAVLTNPQLHEDVTGVEQKPVDDKDIINALIEKAKEDEIPDWKTEQISNQVLDEIRANVDTSKLLKAFPFRKKITLEKVGKLIKLDDVSNRSKRSVVKEVSVINEVNKRNVSNTNYYHDNNPVIQINEANENNKVTVINEAIENAKVTEINEVKENIDVTGTNELKENIGVTVINEDKEINEEDISVIGEYEVYLERTTCSSQVVPGYFRYGNLTRPYPECCPQLINKSNTFGIKKT